MNTPFSHPLDRRRFLRTTLAASGLTLAEPWTGFFACAAPQASRLAAADLPKGDAPRPVPLGHFPDRLHAFVWRNWSLVPVERMARVVGAKRADILRLGRAMGLPDPARITRDQWRRCYLTVIRRNWHLLPYEQLLTLLDWAPDQLAYTLREDDFLYIKLGNHKPACEPLKYGPADTGAQTRAAAIARVLREEFPQGLPPATDRLFAFIERLSAKPPRTPAPPSGARPVFSPRFCYSYFALYGDPLLETDADPYPDGYLARLAAAGANGVWLQAVLHKLAPFPWQPALAARHKERLENLRQLVHRARRYGIGVWLYLNEPRAMPLKFFESFPDLKGVAEGDHATLCTSVPDVQKHLRESIAAIGRAVPDLAGFFTITASENLTNCWSHGKGVDCPRCGRRPASDVIAEVNRLIFEGIQESGRQPAPGSGEARGRASVPARRTLPSAMTLLAWDWGWNDAWAEDIIRQMPRDVALMSVSEWSLPIERGGIKSAVGEYSISAIGPGPRATRHWELARKRGLRTMAKIQAGNTWELSAVPYIPAVENVARHAARLRDARVDGLMLGWTLGGYPSPNLEVVAELGADASLTPSAAMQRVAERRFGTKLAPRVVTAWREFSAAFSEFPFHIGVVYSGPQQKGPANLLWPEPTGYRASMVGFPYDDLDRWRAIYPAETFIAQFDNVAAGFEAAAAKLKPAALDQDLAQSELEALTQELNVAEAAAIHFRSVANQARFVLARRELSGAKTPGDAQPRLALLEQAIRDELRLARRLFALQSRDSRLGFEASNQYYYVPLDLAEKVLNCRDLLDHWLPGQRKAAGR